MHPQDRLPRSARALILLVTAAGLAVVIVRSLDVSKWKGPDAIAWGALALGSR
jgi:hypothetical protein